MDYSSRLRGIYLGGMTLVLGYTAYAHGGFLERELNYSLLAVGLLSLAYWVFVRKATQPLDRWIFWPLALLLCYVLLQIIPVPVPVLRVLSPARAEHVDALGALLLPVNWASVSVLPGATLGHLFRVIAYALVFLTMRRIKGWGAAIPILAVATLEAVLGLVQYWDSSSATRMAQGTYPNHSHYAALLGMALPFAIMYAVTLARREKRSESTRGSTFAGIFMLAAAAVIFLAITFSLSGGGFISCLASLCFMGILLMSRRVRPGWRWTAAAVVVALTVLAFLLIPPDPVVERFAGESRLGEGSRPALWGATMKIFPDYAVFGCGLGGFESALYRKSDIMHHALIDYAHNDYLQLLVELGIVGFLIGVALLAAVLRPTLRAALDDPQSDRGALAIACIGGIAAFLIHCTYNFNFYAPANALCAAMIASIMTGKTLNADGR